MHRFAAIISSVALAGCAGQMEPPPATQVAPQITERVTPFKLDKADVAAIQAGVRRALKDPDSARFGQMLAGTNTNGEIRCA